MELNICFGFNRHLELDLGLGLAVEPVGMVLVLLLDLIFLEREMYSLFLFG